MCAFGVSIINRGNDSMPTRFANFTQSQAKRLFKAAVCAGVTVEFRADGTIVATPQKRVEQDSAKAATSESAEEIRNLI
jgi:hypothetical protein